MEIRKLLKEIQETCKMCKECDPCCTGNILKKCLEGERLYPLSSVKETVNVAA